MRGTDDDDQAEEGEPSSERSFELSKSISLQALSPIALDDIRREGRCTADLTEEIFDRDHPGHYFRQIESVSVSIPTIAGPHTDVDCTLTLIRSSIRISSRLLGGPNGYGRRMKGKAEVRDLRFRDNDVPVTGAGASDRWLPFEGAGVISRWFLKLTNDGAARAVDSDTIADVILRIRYTARDGGEEFRKASLTHLACSDRLSLNSDAR